jgi:putative lipoic acid-binding regulatory protein
VKDTQQPDEIMEFPCSFSIKAMGLASQDFATTVEEIVCRHTQDSSNNSVTTRPSKGGKYLSVTVTIKATSRAQLDAIYQDLSANEQVLMSL